MKLKGPWMLITVYMFQNHCVKKMVYGVFDSRIRLIGSSYKGGGTGIKEKVQTARLGNFLGS